LTPSKASDRINLFGGLTYDDLSLADINGNLIITHRPTGQTLAVMTANSSANIGEISFFSGDSVNGGIDTTGGGIIIL
jgi:hypothetical protein